MIPYFLMAFLFLVLALLAALESSLTGFRLAPWFNGMVWLRVHFITLGALTQILFGGLPILTAIRRRLPRPATRWDIWLTLNAGILTLLVGIPLVSPLPIIVGGALIFSATLLLIQQLAALPVGPVRAVTAHSPARKFYIAGLVYFLLGILIGAGMWTGWMKPLGVVGNPKEVHIHANSWGLLSLTFAGLIIDLYPRWTKRNFANPPTISLIFWLMTLGAFGLVFGPWFANRYLLVPGLLLHLAATLWLLINMLRPLRGAPAPLSPGLLHLISAYFWILAPVLTAPFVLFSVPGVPGADIEALAPQALIYGWALQFGLALLPYLLARLLTADDDPPPGGTWASLSLINLGAVCLWAGIFIAPYRDFLSGGAYLLWALAIVAVVAQLWPGLRRALARLEPPAPLDPSV